MLRTSKTCHVAGTQSSTAPSKCVPQGLPPIASHGTRGSAIAAARRSSGSSAVPVADSPSHTSWTCLLTCLACLSHGSRAVIYPKPAVDAPEKLMALRPWRSRCRPTISTHALDAATMPLTRLFTLVTAQWPCLAPRGPHRSDRIHALMPFSRLHLRRM